MQDSDDSITVICPKCRQQIRHSLGWLKSNPVLMHEGCRAVLEFDDTDFVRFQMDKRVERKPYFTLRLVSRERD